jgi:hypothetical protein
VSRTACYRPHATAYPITQVSGVRTARRPEKDVRARRSLPLQPAPDPRRGVVLRPRPFRKAAKRAEAGGVAEARFLHPAALVELHPDRLPRPARILRHEDLADASGGEALLAAQRVVIGQSERLPQHARHCRIGGGPFCHAGAVLGPRAGDDRSEFIMHIAPRTSTGVSAAPVSCHCSQPCPPSCHSPCTTRPKLSASPEHWNASARWPSRGLQN